MQPLIINLTGKKIVIVGGGKIAAKKAKVLQDEQAYITIIAEEFGDEIMDLANQNEFILLKRKAVPSDFEGAILVILAIHDQEANQQLADSLSSNQLVCVVDNSHKGNVTFPATVRRGHLQIAVTSNGASPKLTHQIKQELEEKFDESWIEYTAFLSVFRKEVLKSNLTIHEKQKLLQEILDENYRNDRHLRNLFVSQFYARNFEK